MLSKSPKRWHPRLNVLIECLQEVVSTKQKLCLARTSFTEAMLSIVKYIIDVEMTHYLRADDVFHHLRSDRCQRNRAIVASCGVVSLLGDGDNVRLLPLLRDCGLLERCPVDGSQDWCQLIGCLLLYAWSFFKHLIRWIMV